VAAAASIFFAAFLALAAALPAVASAKAGQEQKPAPKGSQRVSIPGCVKGYVFTAVRRTEDQPGSVNVPEGTHIRMNGKKDLIKEIDAHKGSVLVITGLMKEGQFLDGVHVGNVTIGPSGGPGGGFGNPLANQLQIDVEGFRAGIGSCPT
jgi:hypothetical protein